MDFEPVVRTLKSGHEIEIRYMRMDDVDDWLRIFSQSPEVEVESFNPESAKHFFKVRLADKINIDLVAIRNNKVIGYKGASLYKARTLRHLSIAQGTFVDRKYRRSGVGEILWKVLYEILRRKKIDCVWGAGPLKTNLPMRHFMKRIGVQVTGVLKGILAVDGRYLDLPITLGRVTNAIVCEKNL